MALLGAQFLEAFGVNDFQVAPIWTVMEAANQTLYLQLIDKSLPSQRYIPGTVGTQASTSFTYAGQVASNTIGLTVANISTVTVTFATDVSTTVALLATALNANTTVNKLLTASSVGGVLTTTANQLGNAGNYIPLLPSVSAGTVTPSTTTYMTGGTGNPGGVTLAVKFMNINDATAFTRYAYNPFPGDLSIWAVPLLQTDPLKGTPSVQFTLIDQASTFVFTLHNALRVQGFTTPDF
jgi:phage tail sheath gpL-like